ncbi:MAG TPA: hypothetical protein V6D08_18745 [Candidatus Obscuribacterales bacterium]
MTVSRRVTCLDRNLTSQLRVQVLSGVIVRIVDHCTFIAERRNMMLAYVSGFSWFVAGRAIKRGVHEVSTGSIAQNG